MCRIKTWVGQCCGVAEISQLGILWLNGRSETKKERNIRIIKTMFEFVEKDGVREKGEYCSELNEKLSCYILTDRVDNNARNICEFFVQNNLGTFTKSPILDNTYRSHIMGSGKSNSQIEVFLLYPNWSAIELFLKDK